MVSLHVYSVDTIGHAFGELDVHRLTIMLEYAFFGRELDVKCALTDGRELDVKC